MDEMIQKIAVETHNPSLREEIIHDLWNSPAGRRFASPEAASEALSRDGAAVVAYAREWLGLTPLG